MERIKLHNRGLTCWNCPAIDLAGKVDFRACGQSTKELAKISDDSDTYVMAECNRSPELGLSIPWALPLKNVLNGEGHLMPIY